MTHLSLNHVVCWHVNATLLAGQHGGWVWGAVPRLRLGAGRCCGLTCLLAFTFLPLVKAISAP
jgi:hypothetical protein